MKAVLYSTDLDDFYRVVGSKDRVLFDRLMSLLPSQDSREAIAMGDALAKIIFEGQLFELLDREHTGVFLEQDLDEIGGVITLLFNQLIVPNVQLTEPIELDSLEAADLCLQECGVEGELIRYWRWLAWGRTFGTHAYLKDYNLEYRIGFLTSEEVKSLTVLLDDAVGIISLFRVSQCPEEVLDVICLVRQAAKHVAEETSKDLLLIAHEFHSFEAYALLFMRR